MRSPTSHYPYLLVLAFLLCIASAACSSGPELKPAEEAVLAGRAEVEQGAEEGKDAAAARDAYRVRGRYNPAPCDCPDFEVHVYGRWTRVWLEAPAETRERLSDLATEAESTLEPRFIELEGVLTNRQRPSEDDVPFPIFEIRP